MLRNICLITLSAFVLVFAAANKNNRGGQGGMSHEISGTITAHDDQNHSFVIADKDTIYYNDQTVFEPEYEKMLILRVGSKVKVKYMNREGDKVAEHVQKSESDNKRSSDNRDTTKNKNNGANKSDTTKNKSGAGDESDTTKNMNNSNDRDTKNKNEAADDAKKDTTKNKSKSGTQDKNDKGGKKGEPQNKERGKDRTAEPDSTPSQENEDRGEGW